MAVLKGLAGQNPTISAQSGGLAFYQYATPGAVAPMAAQALRKTPLIDATNPDSVSVVTQPEAGRAVAQGDVIYLDLTEVADTTSLSMTYTRTTGGVDTDVTVDINVAEADVGGGWGLGEWYMLEVDGSDNIIVEPPEDADGFIEIYASATGLSQADIATAESVSEATVTGQWLIDNREITDSPGQYYGDQSNPLNHNMAQWMAQRARTPVETNFQAVHLFYERGGVYSDADTGVAREDVTGIGHSHLHPDIIGAWGSGARPRFIGGWNVDRMHKLVFQSLQIDEGMTSTMGYNLVYDDIYCDYSLATGEDTNYPITTTRASDLTRGLTIRRYHVIDAYRDTPKAGSWAGPTNRMSGLYAEGRFGVLFDKLFIDHPGWSEDYTKDVVTGNVKPTDNLSHGGYNATDNRDITFSNAIVTRAALSTIQFRASGVVQNVFSAGNNTGFNSGNGMVERLSDLSFVSQQCTMHFCSRYAQTRGGWKSDDLTSNQVVAGGLFPATEGATVVRSTIMNAGTPNILVNAGDEGPGLANTTQATGSAFYWPYQYGTNAKTEATISPLRWGLTVSNWNRTDFPDENVNGVAEATRDAMTIGAYTDALLSTTGSDLDSFCAHLRTLSAPWEEVDAVVDYFTDPFWTNPSRSTSQTVTFKPDQDGGTPGIRADILDDWDTLDLPGTYSGDSIDLAGHKVYWNINPANSISGLTFGAGGELVMLGGSLKPTGTITVDAAGNTLTIKRGAKFHTAGYTGSGVLTVEATDARLLNSGTTTGNVDIVAHYGSEIILAYDAAAFTLQSSRTLTVYGYAKVGFDGSSGGAGSITFATGSTVEFKPAARVHLDGFTLQEKFGKNAAGLFDTMIQAHYAPPEGGSISGDTSGVTATVIEVIRDPESNFANYYILEDMSGSFTDNESVSTPQAYMAGWDDGAQSAFAAVDGTPTHTLGQIREVRTGINGTTAPNVASTINLGGTLHVDVTGLANGDYTLIEVDTIAGTFDAVTAAGNSSKDLTIAITGITMTVTVADGSGAVSGGT